MAAFAQSQIFNEHSAKPKGETLLCPAKVQLLGPFDLMLTVPCSLNSTTQTTTILSFPNTKQCQFTRPYLYNAYFIPISSKLIIIINFIPVDCLRLAFLVYSNTTLYLRLFHTSHMQKTQLLNTHRWFGLKHHPKHFWNTTTTIQQLRQQQLHRRQPSDLHDLSLITRRITIPTTTESIANYHNRPGHSPAIRLSLSRPPRPRFRCGTQTQPNHWPAM